jgi:hypothetical protein
LKITARGIARWAGLSAVVAGLLFVAIQPLHPPDTLASVSTPAWAQIHYLTLVMEVLFVFGIAGIYARQVEQAGWFGFAAFVILTLGLAMTAALGFVEAFVQPLVADTDPAFVQAMLGLVEGQPTGTDLGALATIFAAHNAFFILGTVLFGLATFRANVLPRWTSALFAFSLLISVPVVGMLGAPRLAAVPIGLGLAAMGYALFTERREPVAAPSPDPTGAQPDPAAAA